MPSLAKITFKMRAAGLAAIVLLVLNGCSSDYASYIPPSPPTQAAIIPVVTDAAAEEKLSPPLEMSATRQTDHGGPGTYFVCVREVRPSSERRVISVFFDNDTNKGSRLSVILDACETQTYSPLRPHRLLHRHNRPQAQIVKRDCARVAAG